MNDKRFVILIGGTGLVVFTAIVSIASVVKHIVTAACKIED